MRPKRRKGTQLNKTYSLIELRPLFRAHPSMSAVCVIHLFGEESGSMPQRLSDVPMSDLVPETRAWNDGRGIDLEAWIGCEGRIEHAIAYGELFWPEFTEHDGCVFFAGFSEDGYRGFMQQTGGDRQAVEAVMNHRHILDMFPGSRPARKQVLYFGRLLREMWATKLARDFPDRKFVVSFPEVSYEDLLDYEATFYQKRE